MVIDAFLSVLSKAPAVLQGYWKDLGGAAISFHALRPFIFGKSVRTIEYPDGNPRSLILRWPTVQALRHGIATHHGNLKEHDIVALSRWVSPHFCEPVHTADDLRRIADDGWVIWTRAKHGAIPTRFSIDKGYPMGDPFTDSLLRLVSEWHGSANEELSISEDERDELVMLATRKDDGLIVLYRYFFRDIDKFRQLCKLYLAKRRESKSRIKKRTAPAGKGGEGPDEEEARAEDKYAEGVSAVTAAR